MDIIEKTYQQVVKTVFKPTKWDGSKYEKLKSLSTTDKGTFGENFTTALINNINVLAEVVNGGIGDFDIILKESGITLEHKFATEDVHGCFQFNALDKNKDYDYVFCLGISPNELLFDIYPKSVVLSLTTNMTKAQGGFKMTVRKTRLLPLTERNFKKRIKEVLNNV